MSEMVETVAKHMAAKEGWRWEDNRQMLDQAAEGLQNTGRERDTWRNRARAAIEAMREPTVAMIEAVEGVSVGGPYLGPLDADDIYGQMIDAALSEVEG